MTPLDALRDARARIGAAEAPLSDTERVAVALAQLRGIVAGNPAPELARHGARLLERVERALFPVTTRLDASDLARIARATHDTEPTEGA